MGIAEIKAPPLRKVLRRGWAKRCPRCGRGHIFKRWFTPHEECGECGLRFQPAPGDTWGFWVIGDRIFVAGPMIILYLGFTPEPYLYRIFFLLVIVAVFLLTMPVRLSICIGLDYLSRFHLES
ncbi:MAG TPA: DUF983 domain-containing protein [Acidobacteriota bacterium]|nr:DUF983 domain-containing protein [Acidobacteriota bacterium]